jgi:hypothetical protein
MTEMIFVLSFLKLFLVIRLFSLYSHWTNYRATKVCLQNQISEIPIFAIKCDISDKTYFVILNLLLLSTIIVGIILRVVERPFENEDVFDKIENSWWLVSVTMITIGFGDIVPSTHLGRLLLMISCIWGLFCLSLFVIATANGTEFSEK